ncbi:alpha/beta fold hydrolase [Bacillus sp. HMF5848]|uniref:alpha/beta fold hydrolase n=1 Tax=Bacillus sp. HMF5848 TaxID=2495421 RepID=UPI000F781FEF|nr:alpha/beta fold hydrolase [Bacillus sp. HMF5848]RSK26259.1 alpha/beta fold hydrolase [Bacillus sp. HMF5848]
MLKKNIQYVIIIALMFGSIFGVSFNSVQAEEMLNAEEVAEQFLTYMQEKQWDEMYDMFSSNVKELDEKDKVITLVTAVMTQFTAQYGELTEPTDVTVSKNLVFSKVTFVFNVAVADQTMPMELIIYVNDDGSVESFSGPTPQMETNYQAPTYEVEDAYTEKDVVVGEGKYALPGKLIIPTQEVGPFPTVVLVHGSGPNDMDETIYSTKSFRDMAVGLANEGIAVLRYDKRTKIHGLKASLMPDLTVKEETVDDAIEAVKLVSSMPELDSTNIFVVGHSLGGYVLPRILEADTEGLIAGGISLAGPITPLHELLLWQYEQGLERGKKLGATPEQLAQGEAMLAQWSAIVDVLNNPDYNATNVPAEVGLGNQAAYWFDLRDYDAGTLAAQQTVPLLFLQGEKDLQVPVSELDIWKEALQGYSNVTYKTYPNLTHILVNFAGVPTTLEYAIPANVPIEFIEDIASWVKTGTVKERVAMTQLFTDFDPDAYWAEPMTWAVENEIMKGYETEKLLKPYDAITERQALTILFRFAASALLTDESDEELYAIAAQLGVPTNETPAGVITRGEAAVLFAKLLARQDMTVEDAVSWLYENGIVTGYANDKGEYEKTFASYHADETLTRAQAITILHRINNMK